MNRVTFIEDLCKGCGLCVAVCPKKIIRLDHSKLNKEGYHPAEVLMQEKCSACAVCALMCPDVAIVVESDV